jgi:hypothetical protein
LAVRFLIFTLGLFASTSSFANVSLHSICGNLYEPAVREQIPCLVSELVSNSFPELTTAWSEGRIQFREFHSDAYFLKTSFLKGKLASSREQRVYSVDVNPEIYQSNSYSISKPTLGALRGILAHELIHLKDYELGNAGTLIKIGVDLVLNPASYERFTDERAFELGYGLEIKAYRDWIYGMLDERALAKKKKRYYSPEEIDSWLALHSADR